MSVSQWMDKQNVCPYIGIFFSHKKIWSTDTCNNMNKAWKHCAEKKETTQKKYCAKGKNPDTKGHVLYDSIYLKSPE